MIKPSKVVFIDKKLEASFNSLKENEPIKKSIVRAIHDLRQNAFSGIQIPFVIAYMVLIIFNKFSNCPAIYSSFQQILWLF